MNSQGTGRGGESVGTCLSYERLNIASPSYFRKFVKVWSECVKGYLCTESR